MKERKFIRPIEDRWQATLHVDKEVLWDDMLVYLQGLTFAAIWWTDSDFTEIKDDLNFLADIASAHIRRLTK